MRQYSYLFWLILSGAGLWPGAGLAQVGFPHTWRGTWAGQLTLYQGPAAVDTVPMRLDIVATDSADQWDWILQYGPQDRRAYRLLVADSTAGHYQIDEQNGIVLDAWWLGTALSSRFRVGHSLLLVSYRCQGDTLYMEIWHGPDDQLRPTGTATPDTDHIDNWPLRGHQVAVLYRLEEKP